MPQNLALNHIGLQAASTKEVNIAAKEPSPKKESFKNVLNDHHVQAGKQNNHDHRAGKAQPQPRHDTSSDQYSDTSSKTSLDTDEKTEDSSVQTVSAELSPIDEHLTTSALSVEPRLTGRALMDNTADDGISESPGSLLNTSSAIQISTPLGAPTQLGITSNAGAGLSDQALAAGAQPLTLRVDKNISLHAGGNHRLGGVSNLTGEGVKSVDLSQDPVTVNQSKVSSTLQPASFFDMLQNNAQKNQPFTLKDSLLTSSSDANGTELLSNANSYTNMASKTEGANMLPSIEAKPSFAVNVQFGNAAWSGAIAKQTANLLMQNIQSAELRLNPDDLGPINVKVNVSQDQASVMFQSNNPAVREALEQTVLRLRDLLSQEGLNLLESHVGDNPEFSGQQQGEKGERNAQTQNQKGTVITDDASIVNEQTVHVQYGVDSYA